MPYIAPSTPGVAELLEEFGQQFRRCRYNSGLSQMQLAELSGVTQSTISRMERGKAPMAGMLKLVLISAALGRRFPLGFCPHGHDCDWARSGLLGPHADDTVLRQASDYVRQILDSSDPDSPPFDDDQDFDELESGPGPIDH